MELKSFKLMKTRKATDRKNDLKTKKLQQSMRNELLDCLERDLATAEVVSYEIPEKLLGDFIDILDDDFTLIYSYRQTENKCVFEFKEKQIF